MKGGKGASEASREDSHPNQEGSRAMACAQQCPVQLAYCTYRACSSCLGLHQTHITTNDMPWQPRCVGARLPHVNPSSSLGEATHRFQVDAPLQPEESMLLQMSSMDP